jgi:hypothetical protein
MSSLQYYYLKPATLDTPGFCYDVGDESARGQRIVEVQRLASGRWAEVNEPSKWLPPSALTHRKVTEQEAACVLPTVEMEVLSDGLTAW